MTMRNLICALLLWPTWAHAYTDGAFSAGLGYFTENNFGKITKVDSAASTTFGTATYPLLLKYDISIFPGTFFSPAFTYTILDRKDAADSAKVNIWHLMLPFGSNFYNDNFDWSVGVGLLNRKIQGKGGTVQLDNGTGTATFALPGRTVESRTITFNMGSAFVYGPSRFALDLMIEGLTSEKRSFDIMFSYAYAFNSRGY